MSPRAVNVLPMEDYKLYVTFENGEKKIYDAKPVIKGDWYGRLKDPAVFRTVHIGGLSVEWADGQDLCPDDLYESSMPVK